MYIVEDFSGVRALTEVKVVPYGRVVDNTLIRHTFRAVGYPARVWHGIVVPIDFASWSMQLPPQLHVILAQILHYQN